MKMIQKDLFRVCFQPITTLNCCTTCISGKIGSYNTQQSRHNEHTHFCREKRNMIFRKWGGGVKGRLEIFRKFIRFGGAIRPLPLYCISRLSSFLPSFYSDLCFNFGWLLGGRIPSHVEPSTSGRFKSQIYASCNLRIFTKENNRKISGEYLN